MSKVSRVPSDSDKRLQDEIERTAQDCCCSWVCHVSSPHHCVGFLFFAWIPPLLPLRPPRPPPPRRLHTSLIPHLSQHNTTHQHQSPHLSQHNSSQLHFSHLTYHIFTSHITYHVFTSHSSTSSYYHSTTHHSAAGAAGAFHVAGAVHRAFWRKPWIILFRAVQSTNLWINLGNTSVQPLRLTGNIQTTVYHSATFSHIDSSVHFIFLLPQHLCQARYTAQNDDAWTCAASLEKELVCCMYHVSGSCFSLGSRRSCSRLRRRRLIITTHRSSTYHITTSHNSSQLITSQLITAPLLTPHSSQLHCSSQLITAPLLTGPLLITSHRSTSHHNSSQLITSQLITLPLLTPHLSHHNFALQLITTYHIPTHHSSTSHTTSHTSLITSELITAPLLTPDITSPLLTPHFSHLPEVHIKLRYIKAWHVGLSGPFICWETIGIITHSTIWSFQCTAVPPHLLKPLSLPAQSKSALLRVYDMVAEPRWRPGLPWGGWTFWTGGRPWTIWRPSSPSTVPSPTGCHPGATIRPLWALKYQNTWELARSWCDCLQRTWDGSHASEVYYICAFAWTPTRCCKSSSAWPCWRPTAWWWCWTSTRSLGTSTSTAWCWTFADAVVSELRQLRR